MPTRSFFEPHPPDLDRAKAFHGALFAWKIDELPLGATLAVGEAAR